MEQYWKLRLESCKKALESNNFEVFVVDNTLEAHDIILKEIVPKSGAHLISWGDSMTLHATGVLETLIVTDTKVCKKRVDSISSNALLSIYEKYTADKNIKESEEANMTIIKAFRRAFLCE